MIGPRATQAIKSSQLTIDPSTLTETLTETQTHAFERMMCIVEHKCEETSKPQSHSHGPAKNCVGDIYPREFHTHFASKKPPARRLNITTEAPGEQTMRAVPVPRRSTHTDADSPDSPAFKDPVVAASAEASHSLLAVPRKKGSERPPEEARSESTEQRPRHPFASNHRDGCAKRF